MLFFSTDLVDLKTWKTKQKTKTILDGGFLSINCLIGVGGALVGRLWHVWPVQSAVIDWRSPDASFVSLSSYYFSFLPPFFLLLLPTRRVEGGGASAPPMYKPLSYKSPSAQFHPTSYNAICNLKKKKNSNFAAFFFFQKWFPSLKIKCQVPRTEYHYETSLSRKSTWHSSIVLYTNWIRVAQKLPEPRCCYSTVQLPHSLFGLYTEK